MAAPKVTLAVWGAQDVYPDSDKAMVEAFEKRNPGVTVSSLSMGAGQMNPQKLMTAIVGEVPPDVVLQDRFTIGDWASRGAFMPLDTLLSSDLVRTDEQAIHETNYVPATWKETLYKGHVYAIPTSTDDRLLFYNKNDFRDAGLDPDKPPQTWDDLMSDAMRMTQRTATGYRRVGFIPMFSQGWLYLWSWQDDGEMMSPDGRTCTMDNLQTVDALTHVVSWFDELGGVDAVNAYANGFGSNDQDPIMTGQLAMRVDDDGLMVYLARYKPNLDFGVCPVPVPADRLHHVGRFRTDSTWITWSGGFSYAIPVGSRHVALAWKFIEWMNSPEANLIGAAAQAAKEHEQGRFFVPQLSADNRSTHAVFEKYVPLLPPSFQSAELTVVSLLPQTHFRPVTFVGQKLWDEQVRAVNRATRHEATPAKALADGQYRVQIDLDRVFNEDSKPVVPMRAVSIVAEIATVVVACVLVAAFLMWRRGRRRTEVADALAGIAFIMPWVIGFVVLTLGPMLASLLFSFCDYDVMHPARWAGIANYQSLFTLDREYFAKSLYNAAYLAVYGIPLGMATGLAMAMLLRTDFKGVRYYRTAFYMPSIVPSVATAVLWGWVLNADPTRGLINAFWHGTLTAWFHVPAPGWLAVPPAAKPALVIIGLWGAGGGLIFWLAGLQSIPQSLYEAAAIDGAGPWKQFRRVTIPMLSPYIFFSLIMGTIGALQAFDLQYILGGTDAGGSTGPDDSLLVPVVYLFNNAFRYFKMGYASAIAWILFVIILGLTLGQLKLAPRWVHTESGE